MAKRSNGSPPRKQKRRRVEGPPEDELLSLIRSTPTAPEIRKACSWVLNVSAEVRAAVGAWVGKLLETPDIDPLIAAACLDVLAAATDSDSEKQIMESALWAIARSTATLGGLELLTRIPWDPCLAVRCVKIPTFARIPPENDDIYGVLFFALDDQDPRVREMVLDVFLSALPRKRELNTQYASYMQRAAQLTSELVGADVVERVQIKALRVLKAMFAGMPSLLLCVNSTIAEGSRPPLVTSVLEAWESNRENVRLETLKVIRAASFENADALEMIIMGLRKHQVTGKLLWELRCLMIYLGEQHGQFFAPKFPKKKGFLTHPLACQSMVHRHEDFRLRPKSTDWSRDSSHALLVLFYAGAVSTCPNLALCLPRRLIVEMQKARTAWPSLPWPEKQLAFASDGYPLLPASCSAIEAQYQPAFVKLETISRQSLLEVLRMAIESARADQPDDAPLRLISRSGSPEERRVAMWTLEFLDTFAAQCLPTARQKATSLLHLHSRLVTTFVFESPSVLDAFQQLPHAILHEAASGAPKIPCLPSAEEFEALRSHEALVFRPRVCPSTLNFSCKLYGTVEVEVPSSLPASAFIVQCSYPCDDSFLRMPGSKLVSLVQKEPGLLLGRHRVSLRCATGPLCVSVRILLHPDVLLYTVPFTVTTT